jgi:hypothetical protein
VRASIAREGHVISRAVEKLTFNDNATLGISQQRSKEDREWLISAPGKVILFGEHAVVHGVVSVIWYCHIWMKNLHFLLCRPPLRHRSISVVMDLQAHGRMASYQFVSLT